MGKNKSPVKRILVLMKGQGKMVAVLLFLIIVVTALDLVVPIISQRLIDTLIGFFQNGGTPPTRALFLAVAGILAATIAGRAVSSTYNYQLFKTVTKTEDALKHRAFEKYLTLHALFHHGSSSGQMIGRLERGASAVYSILHDVVGHNLLRPLMVFTGVIIVLLFKNPLIALIVFLPLPIYVFLVKRLSNRIYEVEKRANREFEAVAKESYDAASNVLTVKKFSQESAETKTQVRLQTKARETQYRAERIWTLIENTQTAIATIGRTAVILLGGFLVLQGKSTIGELVLFISLQNMAYDPLGRLAVLFPRLRRNTARAERIFQILDEPVQVTDAPNAEPLSPLSHEISFRHVWFRYGEGRSWALKDINLTVPVRTTVALVGRSGSGKTTFANLLMRSFDPVRGSIAIDGHDLRDATQRSLREQIAVVPQEVDLFSRTIAKNISYGRRRVSHAQIKTAARTALAHDFIMKAERGYRTMVGERGIKLSGGERQRIGIARAVLRDPHILILDEATSHLDTESERLIREATDALIKNRTSFIIAHRLSTVLHADLILVFDNGSIEAMGTHAELLKKSPTYKRLHDLQFAN
ncbi:MAG: ABC transporter ATP-binding protein [Candidatus Brennerbacteria bacterium]